VEKQVQLLTFLSLKEALIFASSQDGFSMEIHMKFAQIKLVYPAIIVL